MQNDKLTGEFFEPRRINQRFVKSENRIKFHNQQANKKRMEVQPIIETINSNYLILKKLICANQNSKLEFSRDLLKMLGYQLKYVTHLINHKDKLAFGIYNIDFNIDDTNLTIIRYGDAENI